MIAEVLNTIEDHNTFVVTSHSRPDGDAVGSVLGLLQVLQQLGKKAEAVLSDGVPAIYRSLPLSDRIIHSPDVNVDAEVAIILECDSISRTGLQNIRSNGRKLVNIDHHSSAKRFADVNWIDPVACATGQLIFELAKSLGAEITPDLATCLYTAVLTDTGSFCFQGTNEQTFALARELVTAGADPTRIAQGVYFANPESKMRLLGAALSSLRRKDDLAWMSVSQQQLNQCHAIEEDCEGLVNYALGIAGVEVAAFFRELSGGRYRVSLRSKGQVDVAAIAARFGGGGHICAGGCSLPGPLPAAAEHILRQIEIQRQGKN